MNVADPSEQKYFLGNTKNYLKKIKPGEKCLNMLSVDQSSYLQMLQTFHPNCANNISSQITSPCSEPFLGDTDCHSSALDTLTCTDKDQLL